MSVDENEITEEVLRRLAATPDPRLREVMLSLVRHLHAFAREVRLTEREWMAGIEFLTATGHMCDDQRQEFILLSDTLGLSSLADVITHAGQADVTASTILGPFYVPGAPQREFGESIALVDVGDPLIVSGTVRSSDGAPLSDATLDVWQTAANGLYDIQDSNQPQWNLRGVFWTGPDGRYQFRTVRPVTYAIPDDGPVGALLRNTGRHPWRAAHIHAIVSAPGHAPVTTHIFDRDDPYLESDAVFGVKRSLAFTFVRHESAQDTSLRVPHFSIDVDFVLAPEQGSSLP